MTKVTKDIRNIDKLKSLKDKIIYQGFDLKYTDKNNENDKYFTFSGYASTYKLDYQGDIVVQETWEKNGYIGEEFPVLWNHRKFEGDYPLGLIKLVRVDDKGLFVEAKLPRADARVRDIIIPQIEIGSIKKMSIGGYARDGKYDEVHDIFYITDFELMEISLVIFPANDEALITSFKSNVMQLQDYSFAEDDTEWDSQEADKRWREYTNSQDKPSDEYKKGFLYYDKENKDNFTAYKFLIVDVIDDEPKIIQKAIMTSVSYINKTYNKSDIPYKETEKIKKLLSKYHKLMDIESPEFKKYNNVSEYYEDNVKIITDISDILKDKGFSNKESNIFISKFKQIINEEISRKEKKIVDNEDKKSRNDNEFWNKAMESLTKNK